MQLTRWIGLCVFIVGMSVVLLKPLLGGEQFVALTGSDDELRIMGGVVAFVGLVTMLIGARDTGTYSRSKGPPS